MTIQILEFISILKAGPDGRFEIDIFHTSPDGVFLHTIAHIADHVIGSKSTSITDPTLFLSNGLIPRHPFPGRQITKWSSTS